VEVPAASDDPMRRYFYHKSTLEEDKNDKDNDLEKLLEKPEDVFPTRKVFKYK